jgi:peptidoglycan/LPS O-acetylase OafA/YrhL
MKKYKTETNYRGDIDGLRALAVLSVIGYHCSERIIPGGFFGVDIFFVISGFLITKNICELMDEGIFTLQEFYIRRINRILPALLTIIIFTLAMGFYVLYNNEFKILALNIAASSLFISNFLSWTQSGYFDVEAVAQPLIHLWSLSVEEQFYLFWPIILLLIFKHKLSFLFIAPYILVISLLLYLYLSANNNASMAFYFPATRLWELISGGVLAYLLFYRKLNFSIKSYVLNKFISNVISVIGITLILLSLLLIDKNILINSSIVHVIPVIGTLLVIYSNKNDSFINLFLTNKYLVFIGLISYPLYLWHWPLLWFVNIIKIGAPSVELRLSAVLLAIIIASVTYKFIEKPIRSINSEIRRKIIAVRLIIILLFIGLISTIIYKIDGKTINGENKIINELSAAEWQKNRLLYKNCKITDLKANLECLQSMESNPKLALIGDSHADHIFQGIAKYDAKNSWLLLAKGSCPPGLEIKSHRFGEKDECVESMQQIVKILDQEKNIHTVVLASLGPFYFSGTGFSPEHVGNGVFSANQWFFSSNENSFSSKEKIFYDGISKMILHLEKIDKKVIFYIDVPELNFSPRECVKRPLSNDLRELCSIEKNIVLARQFEYRKLIASLKLMHPNLKIFDPLNFLCDDVFCKVKIENTILYRDGHHLSMSGSDYLAKPFFNFLKENIYSN